MSNLLIVESPNKAKKIAAMFPDWQVLATAGHIRELPRKEMGVEAPEFHPRYEIIGNKSKVVGRLRQAAAKASIIYIATDLDREGEAIGWHVLQILGKKLARQARRVRYSEVSKRAIQKAIDESGELDMDMVRAQEARRVIDRLVGYTVSPALYRKLGRRGLSAGRVQSIALKLICQREREIKQFEPVEHYGVRIELSAGGETFHAVWDFRTPGEQGESDQDGEGRPALMLDRALAEAVADRARRVIAGPAQVGLRNIAPPPPLITSELIKQASKLYRLSAKAVMTAAQHLFEEGLITYHRTDSPAMDPDFADLVRAWAQANHLPIPEEKVSHAAKRGAQEAHEGVRVTAIEKLHTNFSRTSDEDTLYQLIWFRTLASQLAAGTDEHRTQVFHNRGGEGEWHDRFVAKATRIAELGWREAVDLVDVKTGVKTTLGGEENRPLPEIPEQSNLPVVQADVLTKHTRPPARFTESTLVAKMEALGVGRPSTYASIIETILAREHVRREKQNLLPTPLGGLIFLVLDDQYRFMSFKYTAEMEAAIDEIARSKRRYLSLVSETWELLEREVEQFAQRDTAPLIAQAGELFGSADLQTVERPRPGGGNAQGQTKANAPKRQAGEACPSCSKGTLQQRFFKSGKNEGKPFLGCNNFPTCRHFQWCT